MGAWIEQQQDDPGRVHRVSAQKDLDFPRDLPILALPAAERTLLYGTDRATEPMRIHDLLPIRSGNRWGRTGRDNLSVTPMLSDFPTVLALLMAKRRERDAGLADLLRSAKRRGDGTLPDPPESVDEMLLRFWSDLLPTIRLSFQGDKVIASNGGVSYPGNEMSDGERVLLYLIALCLVVRENSILIIDEPELHIHRSLISRLWTLLEGVRTDCLFVYITQDLDFAASRVNARRIWTKGYDGENLRWDWEEVPHSDNLPEAVVLEVLGSRKEILFTEGERGGLDHRIYGALFPARTIVPRGSCDNVVISTKALRDAGHLHHLNPTGVIDRDFRSDDEIAHLRAIGLDVLEVAEVENVLCVGEIIQAVGQHLGKEPIDALNGARDLVITELSKALPNQAFKRATAEVLFRLKAFAPKGQAETDLVQALRDHTARLDAASLYQENVALYKSIVDVRDYGQALRYFNRKGLYKQIAGHLGVSPQVYVDVVLRLLDEPSLASAVRIGVGLQPFK
jgi:hypothetical protein